MKFRYRFRHGAAFLLAAGAILPLRGMEALPAEHRAPDAAAFAGNADPGVRLFRLGCLASENSDAAAAVDFLNRALQCQLSAVMRRTAIETLHENLLILKDFPKAQEWENQAAKDPEFRDYPERIQWMAARTALAGGRREEALAKLRTVRIAPRPDDEECRRSEELFARAFNAAGDFEAAAQGFEALAMSAGVNGAWRLRALEGALLNALDAGKTAKAREYWARIQSEVPTDERNAQAERLRALDWLIQASDGHFAKIAPDFRKAAAAATAPDPLLARIAQLGAGQGSKATAESLEWRRYAYALADAALRPVALLQLIQSQCDLEQWTAALQSLKTYFELFPTSPERWKLRILAAEVSLKLQNAEAAQRLYESVLNDELASGAERELAAEALAGLHQKAGRNGEAVECFRKAIDLAADEDKRAALTQSLGEYLYLLGRYDEARQLFAPLAERAKRPETGETAALWAVQCDYQLKMFDQALTCCEALTKAKTPDVRRKARYLCALLLESSGRPDEAAARYLAFAEEFPKAEEAAPALFEAGELSLGATNHQAAAIFLRYADLYPGENAANALYKAYGELLFAGKTEAAAVLEKLEKSYPQSKYTIAANFLNVDFLRDSGNPAAALTALQRMEAQFAGKNDADLRSEILYDRALLCDAMHDSAGAFAALVEITEKYADRPIAAQSYFRLGDLKSRLGDLEAAAAYFRQAEERKPGGELALACAGRAADAAYALYARSRQDSYLAQALSGYETLLNSPALSPALRFQTLYKLGRAAEDSGDGSRALKQYGEVLYYAVLARRENAFYAPVWCAKALQAALALLRPAAADAPSAAEREALRAEAIRLLTLAAELELPDENIPLRLEQWRSGAPWTDK